MSGSKFFTAAVARDASFNPTINGQSANIFIDDVAIQPDGKIIISGSHDLNFTGFKTFAARLNADGSTDQTFLYSEETGRFRSTLALLSNGTSDNTFNALSIPFGIVNTLLALPNGKLFVGGKFTLTVNRQERKSLLQLQALFILIDRSKYL